MIKNILIVIIIFLGSGYRVFAEESAVYYMKIMQLNLDKNLPEKVEEMYDEHEALLSKNWMAIERLAISFERRDKIKQAIELYRNLIVDFNQAPHEKILNTPADNIKEEFYTTNKLPLYYYKLAFLNTQLFFKSNRYVPELDRKKFKSRAEAFILLSRKVKVDEEELKLLENQLSEKMATDEKKIYRTNWYATIDMMSWQDRVYLIDTVSGARFNLLSTAIGPCVGGGMKWQNIKYEFNLESCLFKGNSTISSQDTSVSYQQSNILESGIIAGPGFYLRTLSDNVLLGFQIPFMYRKGDWTLPNGAYKFKNNVVLGGGYFLQAKFKVWKLFVRTRLGKIFPNPASHWSVGILYDF